ncbi:MAG: anhydro-N-acetylmuramic acid kinase [Geminicoccaceae bacterium]
MPLPARRTGLDRVRGAPVRTVAGLMSGTSMDGIDVAVCRVAAGEPRLVALLGARTVPWPPATAERLRLAYRADALELARLGRLVGEVFAEAAAELAAELGVDLDLAGSHGQTIAHEHGVATLQIGEAAFIAERLGCPVVSDFRQNDVAAGGCGAPLVPIVDRWLLARPAQAVLALNIGGITNLTAVPPREHPTAGLIGFDCGPGNMVLDELARCRSGGRASCDRDGSLAAAGRVDGMLLAELLAEPALNEPPPRSLGSEQYGANFVAALLARSPPDNDRWHDLFATLTELTVQAVVRAYRLHVAPKREVAVVLVSGGGAHNGELMRRLAAAMAPIEVTTTAAVGLSPDFKEAIAFALLASARLDGIPGNVPEVTGARRRVLLGKVTES